MDKSLLTYDNVKKLAREFGYPFYTKIYDLNIVGFRSLSNDSNTFDDFVTVSYIDQKEQPQIFIAEATTDPGKYWMNNPGRIVGAGAIKEGHYPRLWKQGMHKEYKALVQVGPVTVYRDNNRDSKFDYDTAKIETGYFGANLHRAFINQIAITVDKWSAMCQVIADPEKFNNLIVLTDRQINCGRGAFYSYTLYNEEDIVELL